MTLPLTGTADVTNGDATVVFTGATLTDYNCPAGVAVAIDGVVYFVSSRTNTTTFELTRVYAGSTAGAAICEISAITANGVRTAALHNTVAEYDARLALLDAYGKGLFYTILGDTAAADPGAGMLARDAVVWADVTALYFDKLDAGGFDSTPIIDKLTANSTIIVRSLATRAYAMFELSAVPALGDNGESPTSPSSDWRMVTGLTYLGGGGSLADAEDVAIEWNRPGTTEYALLSGTPSLGDAAAKNTGTTAGTVAAGDDSRITGALQAGTEDQTVSGGARVTLKDLGNLSGASITPDPGDRPIQKITNNGAGSILPGSDEGQYTLLLINTTGAGAVTTTGWTLEGDSLDTTTTSKFVCSCIVTSDVKLMTIVKVA